MRKYNIHNYFLIFVLLVSFNAFSENNINERQCYYLNHQDFGFDRQVVTSGKNAVIELVQLCKVNYCKVVDDHINGFIEDMANGTVESREALYTFLGINNQGVEASESALKNIEQVKISEKKTCSQNATALQKLYIQDMCNLSTIYMRCSN